MGPIKRDKQLITQKFNPEKHRGVDLRCVDDITGANLAVIATEQCQVLREGVDGFGNYFIVMRPLDNDSFTELKYIHIMPTNHRPGTLFKPGDYISRCMIGGNSKELHLHFETWKQSGPVDPCIYFDLAGIVYKSKEKQNG
ncbi:MAG: peptidoglycan DD-metalloendopeptidase family protein [Phycisphaerae bacterium]